MILLESANHSVDSTLAVPTKMEDLSWPCKLSGVINVKGPF